ncbi:MAG: hypothetical protein AAFR56_00265 [Chloroflexota bacterium]
MYILYGVDVLATEAQLSIVGLTVAAIGIAWVALSIEWFISRGLPMFYVFTDQHIIKLRYRAQNGEIIELDAHREIPREKVLTFRVRVYTGLPYLVMFPYHETTRNRVQIGPLDDPDAVYAYLERAVKSS